MLSIGFIAIRFAEGFRPGKPLYRSCCSPASRRWSGRMDAVKKIAEAVLYEGYILWPYRRSAIKNQQRWTFGGVYPRAYSEARGGDDPPFVQTQCLVLGDGDCAIEVRVRFLHV